MRPGYLSNYGENYTKLGNQGEEESEFVEFESGYIPEYMRYSKVFPNLPIVRTNRPLAIRHPKTFNVLMI